MQSRYPRRIVCLTEEPTEVLYALGLEELIVGISGFTVRPARARREKPRVSAFTSAKLDRILELRPDLVIGFSDIQADIAHALIKSGIEVWISNHRSVEGILGYVRRLGAMVGAGERAESYALELEAHVEQVRRQAAALERRPRVYFEEWDEPLISGIRWVSELIGIAGGDDVFPERAACSLAKDRILGDAGEVIRRAPDLMLASWCGKRFRPERVRQAAALLPRRPRIYFEEWDEPLISGIRWVSELVGIAGGDDVFPERAACALGKDRILADPSEVIRRAPDIILGSWCGKRFRGELVASRSGWDAVPAVRDGELHEIKSPIILQPGPAALTDGLDAIHRVFQQWARRSAAAAPAQQLA